MRKVNITTDELLLNHQENKGKTGIEYGIITFGKQIS